MVAILGINVGRESGASVIIEDKIVAAVNEERLSRKKMAYGFPHRSIGEVLAIANITLSNIDVIAIEGLKFNPTVDNGFNPSDSDFKKKFVGKFALGRILLANQLGLLFCHLILLPNLIWKKYSHAKFFRSKNFAGKILYIDHHKCHANTAYLTQKKKDGIAITFDANGEGFCSKVYICSDGLMRLVHKEFGYNSPAYYYAYVTKILGFTPNRHEGKITGLAAHGQYSNTKKILEKYLDYIPSNNRFINRGGFHLKAIDQLKLDLNNFSKEDIAAGIQRFVEETVTSYISRIISKYSKLNSENIFLAGGLFSNVKLNQKISELPTVKSLYVFPNMGDGGLNLGAALDVSIYRNRDINNLYLGREFGNSIIESELIKSKLSFTHSSNLSQDIARLLLDRKVVAYFNSRMEYGPRSLGNRSILFLANDKNVNSWLNQRLGRTEFMPFAPVIRDVDAGKYFEIDPAKDIDYRFMTTTVNVTPHCRAVAPAIVHIDGTARPQIITRDVHCVYYDVLSSIDKITGEGILVNTSFNMHEEPIVNTPSEAINCFLSSKLDCLIIGDYIIKND